MRCVKGEFKALDCLFRREKFSDPTSLNIIATSYRTAQARYPSACEVAHRRYRAHEHRLTTCRQMYISESNYYRLLAKFLQIAKGEYERLFPS